MPKTLEQFSKEPLRGFRIAALLNQDVEHFTALIDRAPNAAFDEVGARPGDYYPAALREEIDGLNERIYETVSHGLYKAGFATTQTAYEDAVGKLFETLDWLEDRLVRRRYLCGDRVTEADIRLFVTLLRFDLVYFSHFKCNVRRIEDYPNLSAYTRHLYQMPGARRHSMPSTSSGTTTRVSAC
jgi:putative glutathione S-transferase